MTGSPAYGSFFPAPQLPTPTMRLFTSVVALIALVASLGCLFMIPRYTAMYAEFDVALPVLTQVVLKFHGLLAGFFFLIALVLAVLGFVGEPKIALTAGILALILLIVSSIMIPVSLMLPMSTLIQSLDDSDSGPKATSEAP